MKRPATITITIMILITVGCAGSSLPCHGETACQKLVVRSQVEAAAGELSLADLLAPGTCPRWYREAAQVSLGAVPRAGGVRVLEGEEIRRLIGGIRDGGWNTSAENQEIMPQRIVVRQARAVKSCAEIARVISAAEPALGEPALREALADPAPAESSSGQNSKTKVKVGIEIKIWIVLPPVTSPKTGLSNSCRQNGMLACNAASSLCAADVRRIAFRFWFGCVPTHPRAAGQIFFRERRTVQSPAGKNCASDKSRTDGDAYLG